MKKILGMILGLGLLCSSAIAAEEAQTQEGLKVGGGGKKSSIGWFVGAGMGMVNFRSAFPFFAMNVNGGVMFPQTERLRHLISADLGYMTMYNWDERVYNAQGLDKVEVYPSSAKSNGYGIEFTLNYNLSYDVFKTDNYTFAVLGGLGAGGSYTETKYNGVTTGNSDPASSNFVNYSAFIINANFGIRNVIFKNHSIDLMLKSRIFEVASLSSEPGLAATNKNFTFLVSYTFLKF